MVSTLNTRKRILLSTSFYILSCAFSIGFAGEFFTIIGPDGRPMVVQRKANEVQAKRPLQETKRIDVMKPEVNLVIPQSSLSTSSPQSVPLKPQQQVIKQQAHTIKAGVTQAKGVPRVKQVDPSVPPHAEQLQHENQFQGQQKTVEQSPLVKAKQEALPITQPVVIKANTTAAVANEVAPVPSTMFNQMDGTEYVRNEYLEDREFNLEGKKRFYTMPEGVIDHKTGATRFQVIEREKGVSKSVLNFILKPKQKENLVPIVLASTYYRMPKQDTIESLGQICFNDKKVEKAKTLQVNHDINVWPKKPLKEKFEFEIIKIENNVQNIQLNSYASRQNDPTFYWPFAVFLDEKACVIEGAGGFKNDENSSSMLSHGMIAGTLHVPEQSHYLLLTPLSSAIDVEHKVLTNHGQLKLIAIR